MARWLVNRNDTQFGVEGLAGLKELARTGQLGKADMIQPPGTTEWLYAYEVPDLEPLLQDAASDDFDDLDVPARGGGMGNAVLAAVLLGVIAAGGFYVWQQSSAIPTGEERLIGEGGLSYNELVVTGENVQLFAEPSAAGAAIGAAPSGQSFEMLAKRGDFYKVRGQGGREGWLPAGQVLPMYQLGGQEMMKEYDPLFNPDRYVIVANASWMQLPEQQRERITVFQFMLANQSKYDMTDLVLVARIKDAKGMELEEVEIPVEGVVPAEGNTMVGTIVDPESDERRLVTQTTFQGMAAEDPELRLEWADGVEVEMSTEDFTAASIDILQLRAVPGDGAAVR